MSAGSGTGLMQRCAVLRDRCAAWLGYFHLAMTVAWFAMVPIAIATGWIASIVFISGCSIYANAVGHFSAWQAARAEQSGA